MQTIRRFALPALLAIGAQFPGAATAQDKAQPAPMAAAAPAAPLAYESAFSDYRADKETPAVAWKESNARVAEPLPGHAGHAMDAMKHHGHHQQPTPAKPPATDNKDPHHGHHHPE